MIAGNVRKRVLAVKADENLTQRALSRLDCPGVAGDRESWWEGRKEAPCLVVVGPLVVAGYEKVVYLWKRWWARHLDGGGFRPGLPDGQMPEGAS